MDYSTTGFPVFIISQFMSAKSLQSCSTPYDPMDCSPQAPLSMGFSRQEYWSVLPYSPPGDLHDPWIKPMFLMSPALIGRFSIIEAPGEALSPGVCSNSCHWFSDAIKPSHSLSPPSPPAFNLSQHQGFFQWVSSVNQVAKVLKSQHQSSNIFMYSMYSGLISFRIDWFDLLAIQETLSSFLQHHSLKASVLWCSAIFMFHLSYPYMTTGKTIALTRRTFVG